MREEGEGGRRGLSNKKKGFKKLLFWSCHHGAVETNLIRNHEVVGSILAFLSGLR